MKVFFQLDGAGSSVWREIRAGFTTFLAMVYILAVNPKILAEAGMPAGDVFTASCIAAGVATLVMGFWARYPIALAPGMGLNAFFAFTLCGSMDVPWQAALAAVFVAGVVFLVLSLTGVREALMNAVPPVLVAGCCGGIGLFIAFIGLQHGGIVVAHPETMVTLGEPAKGVFPFVAGGILVTGLLVSLRVPGALLISIIGTWAALVAGGQAALPATYCEIPSLPTETMGCAITRIPMIFTDPGFATVVLTLVFIDLFDTMGTLMALTTASGIRGENGSFPRAGRAFSADAIGTITGGLLGTSTVTSYIESGSGIAAGGRSGLTAVVVGILFLLALPFGPVVKCMPMAATAPVLVVVGALMLAPLSRMDFQKPTVAIPLLVMLLGIPAFYSIEKGLGCGFIAYTACRAGRTCLLTWLITIAFLARFIFLA